MNQPAAFAWISCVGEKGGAETLMIECLRALDRSRFTPHVIQLRPGPLEQALREIDVQVHVLRMHRMREIHRVAQAIWQIRGIAKREHLALLHSNGFRAHAYGGLGAALAGIPEVWTTHTVEQPSWSISLILSIPTAHVLANCPRTEKFYKDKGFPTTMIWPGVNAAKLELGTPRAELAARHGLPPNKRWVSVGARLQRFKGQIHFLRALASLPPESDVHGIVIGGSLFGQETEYETELKNLAKELGIASKITFTGFVSDADLAGLLAASSLVVHPALEEDFGLTVAEAQALGVPVAAFAAVGPAAIIEDGKTGWLAPVGDQAALDRVLNLALSDDQRLRAFGAAGKVRCRALFGADEHARKTETVYTEALAR
jgi:glycosyltransferase involved in cell wall biosynthesis